MTRKQFGGYEVSVIENKFGACDIEHHEECRDGYSIMLNSQTVAICSCKCHEDMGPFGGL